jgi:hypothetical protein
MTIKVTRDPTEYSLFTGRVKKATPRHGINGEELIEFQLAGVVESLNNRPITTETVDMRGRDLIEYLLDDYGGIDTNFLDIPFEDNSEWFSDVNVSENSIMAGVRKIAQACNVEIFVGGDGKIKTETKKDALSAVDYTLDKEDIASDIQEAESELSLPSVCRVRGRWRSPAEAPANQAIPRGFFSAVSFTGDKLLLSILPSVPVSQEQALSATVITYANASSARCVGIDSSSRMQIQVNATGAGYEVDELNEVELEATVPPDHQAIEKEVEKEAIGLGLNESIDRESTIAAVVPEVFALRRPNADRQMLHHADEASQVRIEVVRKHVDSVAQVGVRYMTVDNIYIQDDAAAQTVADRALYEKLLATHTLSCSGPWLEGLREVNKVVEVPVGYSGEVLTCLLVGLTVSYTAGDMTPGSGPELNSNYRFVNLNV